MLVIGPALGGEHRAAEADDQDQAGEDAIPEIDPADPGDGGGVHPLAHHDQHGGEHAEQGEDQEMMADREGKIENDGGSREDGLDVPVGPLSYSVNLKARRLAAVTPRRSSRS